MKNLKIHKSAEEEFGLVDEVPLFEQANDENLSITEVLQQLENETSSRLPDNFEIPSEVMEAIYSVGHRFYETEQYEKALSTFSFLLGITPTSAKSWMGLGATHQMLKNYETAIGFYYNASELDQKDPYSLYHLAECQFAIKEKKLGQKFLKTAKERALKNKKYAALIPQIELLLEAWGPKTTTETKKPKKKI